MILADDLVFAEGPRWHDGRLWVSDMHAGVVITLGPDGERTEICKVPSRPSGLGFLEDGSLLIASMLDRRVLRWDGRQLRTWVDLSTLVPFHVNDLLVDHEGRAWVGNFGFDLFGGAAMRTTGLVRCDGPGRAEIVATDLAFPNGMARIDEALIVAETARGRLTAFTVGRDGGLTDRRVWAELPGLPDGIARDGDGIWVACPIGGTWQAQRESRFVRVLEGGEVTDTVAVTPGFRATACAVGGGELFLLEARTADPDEIGGPGNSLVRTHSSRAKS